MIVYGIKNCNTVKKGLSWLRENGLEYDFHDYKKAGISSEKLESWADQVGWESLLNRKGMTWRKMNDEEKEIASTREGAIKIMQEKTSVIKRPLVELDGKVLTLGFDEEEYHSTLL